MVVAPSTRGALFGLAAAATFGVSAPLSKLLLPSIAPLVLAGLLYLGGGVALTVYGLVTRTARRAESGLQRSDLPRLAVVVALGGIGGPLLMMLGLQRTSGFVGSLLLNLEGAFTIALALLVFREHLGRRESFAALLVVAGAALIAVSPGDVSADPWGVAALAGAGLCWAIDNNLTQGLSLRDPVVIVRTKALGAGACSLVVALGFGLPTPTTTDVFAALLLGSVSFGLSLLLDLHGLRLLGAARAAAYFATAPFLGAAVSVVLLQERFGLVEGASGLLMATGVTILIRERHRHDHTHEAIEHEHLHVHDSHHGHTHEGPEGEPHSHPHRHAPLTHDHPHVSDLHHRHGHH